MSFLTDAELTTELRNLLQQPDGLTATFWTVLITSSNTAAYAEIRRKLLARGYTVAQIALWDDGQEFQKDVALYWVLTRGVGKHDLDSKAIKAFDRREELRAAPFSIAGVLINPPTGVQVTAIDFDTGGDSFPGYQDPNDSRLGDPDGPQF